MTCAYTGLVLDEFHEVDLNFLSSWVTFVLISISALTLSPVDSNLQAYDAHEFLSFLGHGEVGNWPAESFVSFS